MNVIENREELFAKIEEMIGEPLPVLVFPEDGEEAVVTIFGEPQQNLIGLLLKQADISNALDGSFMHGYRSTITYGEQEKIVFIDGDKKIETAAGSLAEILSAFGESGVPVNFEMTLPCDALKGITIRVIASDNEFDDITYDDAVLSSDYCLMSLRAMALLSMSERRFLRKVLIPGAVKRLGVLVLDAEMIPENGRQEIVASLDSFFKGEVPICYPTENPESFKDIIDDIKAGASALRDARKECIRDREVYYAKVGISNAIEEFTEEDEKLEDAIELLSEKAKALPSRQDTASRRCRMKYLSPLQVEYSGALSDFYKVITDKLHEEIEKGADIEKMQRIIPGYLNNEWSRETDRIMNAVRVSSDDMERYLVSYIENDIRDFLQDGNNVDTASYMIRLTNLYPEACFKKEGGKISVDKAKDRTMLKKGGTIAMGVGALLLGHPLIGAGVAIYGLVKGGSGEALKAKEQDLRSLTAASDKLCTDYYESAVEWLERVFREMNENMNNAIREIYTTIMDGMLSVIRTRQDDIEARGKSLEELKQLEKCLDQG